MKGFKKSAPVMGKAEFVRYAGVVGDFNPVHFDLEFAQSLKMPAVISQGPLTFTLALDAAAQEIGLDKIKGFGARVTAPVFPDTGLTISCDDEGAVTVDNGKAPVLEGKLVAR